MVALLQSVVFEDFDHVLVVTSCPHKRREARAAMGPIRGLSYRDQNSMFKVDKPWDWGMYFLLDGEDAPEKFTGYCGKILVLLLDHGVSEEAKEVLRGCVPEEDWRYITWE